MELPSRIKLQVAHIAVRTEESSQLLSERVIAVEQGVRLLEEIAGRLGGLGRLEGFEGAVRVLTYWCTARVVTASTLILGGSWSEGMEILRSGLEGLAQQHLFVTNEEELNAWFDGKELKSGTLLKAVKEEGFGRFWATLSKHAHPTLDAVGAYAKLEAGTWVFDPTRAISEGELYSALDAAAALIERQIQLIANIFGGRLSPSVDDAAAFSTRFNEFRSSIVRTVKADVSAAPRTKS